MFFQRKDFAVIASQYFINPVAEIDSAVVVNRLKLLHRHDSVSYHSYLHTIAPKSIFNLMVPIGYKNILQFALQKTKLPYDTMAI